ncbi:MAG: SMC-Scp complex subunit ScpB [Myxococcota bacterium]
MGEEVPNDEVASEGAGAESADADVSEPEASLEESEAAADAVENGSSESPEEPDALESNDAVDDETHDSDASGDEADASVDEGADAEAGADEPRDDGDEGAENEVAEDEDANPPLPGEDTEEGPGLERSMRVAEGHLKAVLESLIFVADRPVKDRQLARAAKAKVAEVRPLLVEIQADYADRGINLVEVATGYQFRSALANAPFVREFVSRKPVRLSRAQLETLAIVAYRQPVTRPEVDDIRGVDSGASLKLLTERELIKVLGRKDEPGRPLLYGTSPNFLEFFGLTSLKDLPTLKEFTELSDESRGIFERRMGESLDFSEAEREAKAAEAAAQEAMFGDDEDEDEEGAESEGARDADDSSDSHEAMEDDSSDSHEAMEDDSSDSHEAMEDDSSDSHEALDDDEENEEDEDDDD